MREITNDVDTIESIIRNASVCRIALSDDGQPYVVPVCYGYADSTLYFHSQRQEAGYSEEKQRRLLRV